MLYTTAEETTPSASPEDYSPTWWMKQKAAFQAADEHTLTSIALDYWDYLDAGEGEQALPEYEAKKYLSEAGVTLAKKPKGMTKSQLDLLINRQKRIRDNEQILRAGDVGFWGSLAPSLLANITDPLFVATDLAVGAGIGTVAKGLRGASLVSKIKRGVVEGAVAGAAVEPAVFGLARGLGDEYTVQDSLTNVAFGAGAGGILGGAIGAVGKRIRRAETPGGVANKIIPEGSDAPVDITLYNKLDDLDQKVAVAKKKIGHGTKGKEEAVRELNDLIKQRDRLVGDLPKGEAQDLPNTLDSVDEVAQALDDGEIVRHKGHRLIDVIEDDNGVVYIDDNGAVVDVGAEGNISIERIGRIEGGQVPAVERFGKDVLDTPEGKQVNALERFNEAIQERGVKAKQIAALEKFGAAIKSKGDKVKQVNALERFNEAIQERAKAKKLTTKSVTSPAVISSEVTSPELNKFYLSEAKKQLANDQQVSLDHVEQVHIDDAYKRMDKVNRSIEEARKGIAKRDLSFSERVGELRKLEAKREKIITEIDGTIDKDIVKIEPRGDNPRDYAEFLRRSLDEGATVMTPEGRVFAIGDDLAFLDGSEVSVDELFSARDSTVIMGQVKPRTPRPVITGASRVVSESIYVDKEAEANMAKTRKEDASAIEQDIEEAKVYGEDQYDKDAAARIDEEVAAIKEEAEEAKSLWRCLRG